MSTKYIIAEQIQYRLSKEPPFEDINVLRPDIYKAIEQKVNSMFHVEQLTVNLPAGETIPDSLSIGIYDNIPVTSLSNGRSRCTLPIMPISLPRNMGVFQIEDPNGFIAFIPLLPSQRILLKSQPLLNDLMGQVGFIQKGKTIEFTKDITLLDCPLVSMQLIVFDMSQYSETDMLPIPADMEETIVNDLVKQFAGIVDADDNNKGNQ